MNKQITYEEVVVGEPLPTLVKQPTPRQLVMWAGASQEFSEMHYDTEFALSMGFPGRIVHGMLMASFLGQVITDWMGELGTLKRIKTQNRQFVLVNERITCKGTVTRKYVKDGECCVECELSAENDKGEKCVTATVLVTLPE
jgi:acyl dehydratase